MSEEGRRKVEHAKINVWLKSIEYTGANVGSNTEFDVSVNGETVHISTDMKAGTRKLLDRLVLTQPTDQEEDKVTISVTAVEEDVAVDDIGRNTAEHVVRTGEPRRTLPSLSVSVQEDRGILGKGATATFTLQFEVEYLATGTVTACCWNGVSDKTRTLGSYYAQTERHRRMADYIAGTCAYFNLQAAVGHAIGSIEDGVSKPKPWVKNRAPSANWMQLSKLIIERAFLRDFWLPNSVDGLPVPELDDVFRLDVLNAAAGIWYLSSLSPGNFGDDGISFKSTMYKAMQYNWGPEYGWPRSKDHCRPDGWKGQFAPSAYAWTMAFLAWGNGYAVPDTRYTSEYAQYALVPQIGPLRLTEQTKQLSPLLNKCNRNAQLQVPNFIVRHATRVTPYGRRSQRQAPRERQIVILARKTSEGTDHDFISALAVATRIPKAFRNGVAPMVTADTYFACESMKHEKAHKSVCVIVLGSEARNDVEKVFPVAHAYSGFSAWVAGADDGYVDASHGSGYQDNYRKALEEAIAAYRGGY